MELTGDRKRCQKFPSNYYVFIVCFIHSFGHMDSFSSTILMSLIVYAACISKHSFSSVMLACQLYVLCSVGIDELPFFIMCALQLN